LVLGPAAESKAGAGEIRPLSGWKPRFSQRSANRPADCSEESFAGPRSADVVARTSAAGSDYAPAIVADQHRGARLPAVNSEKQFHRDSPLTGGSTIS